MQGREGIGMRKKLITLHKAQELYGIENTTFPRPRYVPDGACEWCGSPIAAVRRKSCCCTKCTNKFRVATSSVMYKNTGSASGYRNHIFRRDDYTCQKCKTPYRLINENGISLPTTDGHLDAHHIIPVSNGGTDAPDNLITLCRDCHKKIHRH